MARTIITGNALYDALVVEQFPIPEHCHGVEIEMPVRGPLGLVFRVFVDGENAQKLGRALVRCGERGEINHVSATEGSTPMTEKTTPPVPIDIQAKLDELLASNPEAQKYISKLYYVQGETPADVTHTVHLASVIAPERALIVGAVVLPQYAVILDALLAMAATQPPPA